MLAQLAGDAPAKVAGVSKAKSKASTAADEEFDDEPKPKPKAKAKAKAPAKTAAKKKKVVVDDEDDDDGGDGDFDDEPPKPKVPSKKASAPRTGRVAVDRGVNLPSASVVPGWGCLLNQTNVQQNNNKFYCIQLLESGGRWHVWNRWGRVGEHGMSAMKGPFSTLAAAEKEFQKKVAARCVVC